MPLHKQLIGYMASALLASSFFMACALGDENPPSPHPTDSKSYQSKYPPQNFPWIPGPGPTPGKTSEEVIGSPIILSFTGPFSESRKLLEKPTDYGWLKITNIYFNQHNVTPVAEKHGITGATLGIFYGTPTKKSSAEMHMFVTIKDRSGESHTIKYGTTAIPQGPYEASVGSVMGIVIPADCLSLPVKVSEITELKIVCTPQKLKSPYNHPYFPPSKKSNYLPGTKDDPNASK